MSKFFFENMPSGPLDEYRKHASFDWKKMKAVFEENVDCWNTKLKIWKTLSEDPLFSKSSKSLTTDQMKKIAIKRLHRSLQLNFFPPNFPELSYTKRLKLKMACHEGLASSFPEIAIKQGIGVYVIHNTLTTLGTDRHNHFLEAIFNGKVVACVALTEVSHGSNTKQMKTTAIFDKSTQEFIINTPDFEAAKCWIGNAGIEATLAIVFAQLITNEVNYGIHPFIVPIRDPKTLLPYNGLIIRDLGEKIGLHGIDNGLIMFQNYRIPRENLLNRTADVSPEGEYESNFVEPEKIFGAILENLMLARVGILQGSADTLIKAVTTAVRYASVRKQFSDEGSDNEIPIIEYQLHQWRVFPYVASAVAFKIFMICFAEDYLNAVEKSKNCHQFEEVSSLVSEMHAMVSGAKPLITWVVRDALQECREACGGHGYLKASGLGDLKANHDATVTYEGDNNVLQQQSSNWLLKQWTNLMENKPISSPLLTSKFLENYTNITNKKYRLSDDFKNSKYIMECYEWLITYLILDVSNLMKRLQKKGNSKFAIRNSVQVYRAHVMSRAYAELNVLRYYWNKIEQLPTNLCNALRQFGLLYGLWSLDRHISYFYQGGYCEGPQMAQNIKDTILDLCSEIKLDVNGMVDALAPPDFVLNSVLGNCDGKIYENLRENLFSIEEGPVRPDWWKEVIIKDAPDFTKVKLKNLESKL